jgi:hypothetical protein
MRDLPHVKKEWRDAVQGHGERGRSEQYGTGVYRKRLNEAKRKAAFDVNFFPFDEAGSASIPA